MELLRGDTRIQNVKKTVAAGTGVVIPETLELALPAGAYQFRLTRGPEYKSLTGNFTLQRTSSDAKSIELPRMLDMKAEGWLSCDMAVPATVNDLPVRMLAEDLHAAVTIDRPSQSQYPQMLKKAIAQYQPLWTDMIASASPSGSLLAYGTPVPAPEKSKAAQAKSSSSDIAWLSDVIVQDQTHVAIANPFTMNLPIWLSNARSMASSSWGHGCAKIEKC